MTTERTQVVGNNRFKLWSYDTKSQPVPIMPSLSAQEENATAISLSRIDNLFDDEEEFEHDDDDKQQEENRTNTNYHNRSKETIDLTEEEDEEDEEECDHNQDHYDTFNEANDDGSGWHEISDEYYNSHHDCLLF